MNCLQHHFNLAEDKHRFQYCVLSNGTVALRDRFADKFDHFIRIRFICRVLNRCISLFVHHTRPLLLLEF